MDFFNDNPGAVEAVEAVMEWILDTNMDRNGEPLDEWED